MGQSSSWLISHTLILTIFGSPFPWCPFQYFALYSIKDEGKVLHSYFFFLSAELLMFLQFSQNCDLVFCHSASSHLAGWVKGQPINMQACAFARTRGRAHNLLLKSQHHEDTMSLWPTVSGTLKTNSISGSS